MSSNDEQRPLLGNIDDEEIYNHDIDGQCSKRSVQLVSEGLTVEKRFQIAAVMLSFLIMGMVVTAIGVCSQPHRRCMFTNHQRLSYYK